MSFVALTLAQSFKDDIHAPILAPILESRTMALTITGAAVLHCGLMWWGLPSWTCPIRSQLGIPCPGCGLSRAISAFVHGDWQASFRLHAFAPLFLIALLVIAVGLILPLPQRHWLIKQVDLIERKTGITAVLLIGLVFYWLVRLTFFHETFVKLIMG
jgi:hypothetical protein